MKQIRIIILKIILFFIAVLFFLATLGGVIACTIAENTLTLVLCIILSIHLFTIGTILFYAALKKVTFPRSENQNIYLDNDIQSSSLVSTNKLTTTSTKSKAKDDMIVESPKQYIEDGNTIIHADGSQIADEEIPYLIQSSYEQTLRDKKESSNPKFCRTEHEDELSFNFEMKHGNELIELIDQFEDCYHDAFKTDDLSQRIDLLNRALIAFKKAKRFAYSKGKGGTIFFQDMYECMHNSRNSCFSYADLIQESLDSALQERDIIIPGILQVISENDGILQKNIYPKLPLIPKSDIQRVIRTLEAKHRIIRIKKSNSYELHIAK